MKAVAVPLMVAVDSIVADTVSKPPLFTVTALNNIEV